VIADDPVAGWAAARSRADTVLLDGFHAVKHALRFGAAVLAAVTSDRAAALALATELAPDVRDALAGRLVEVDRPTFARLTGPVGGTALSPPAARRGDPQPGDSQRAEPQHGQQLRGDAPRTERQRGDGHHTGVAALARRAPWSLISLGGAERTAPLVFLDGPRHPGNYGAVVRVAAGLGASGVASTGTLDPWHPAVVRGAAGLHFALPVLRVETAAALDGPVVALDAGGNDAAVHAIPDNAVLAFGSERRGLSSAVRNRADLLLALPMRPGVASYNLASAVAMVLYQWRLAPWPHGNPRRLPA
jgi:tRNA G18 (ribose-2'-O)-methylase SpoU